jgi:integrating conjugative element protein (TIGR03749 family)
MKRADILLRLLLLLVLTWVGSAAAAEPPPERVAWRKAPLNLELRVGSERLIHFPAPVRVGVPPALQGALRVQSVAGTLYLLAHRPFAATRLVVRDLGEGATYLLDVTATAEATAAAPLTVYLPDAETETAGGAGEREYPTYGYVSLTRFAAQQLYAPARLLRELPGVVRVAVAKDPVPLVRGGAVEAVPLVAWRAGELFLTAVRLANTTGQPRTLDPRTLRGDWLTATFQHHRLHPAGDAADRTVVYLISARPFAESL